MSQIFLLCSFHPNKSEDFDGFQDEDGCPEADNDQDGVLLEDDCDDENDLIFSFQDEEFEI